MFGKQIVRPNSNTEQTFLSKKEKRERDETLWFLQYTLATGFSMIKLSLPCITHTIYTWIVLYGSSRNLYVTQHCISRLSDILFLVVKMFIFPECDDEYLIHLFMSL